ncbi:MAG: polysaccharide deacetylase family protein [Candidatus Falkowbacteria bacterium]|nr:polysaccharide deacetylase family protein [Candidatus Falkowbacteria bacterium]
MYILTIILLVILIIIGLAYYFTVWSKTQIFGYFPYSIKTDKKIIALTFDDGPNPPYTNELLTILARHNVKATFFLTGKRLSKFPELGQALVKAGHIIGNHSYSHKFTKNFTSLSFETEITRAQKVIEEITGKRPALYRSPWLFRQPWLLRNLRAHGLTPVAGFFSSSWEAWHAAPKIIATDAFKTIAPGRIIIFHDGADINLFSWDNYRAGSVGAIDLIIPELKKQGYEFLTVDQLLGVAAYQTI